MYHMPFSLPLTPPSPQFHAFYVPVLEYMTTIHFSVLFWSAHVGAVYKDPLLDVHHSSSLVAVIYIR
jgi:hypothetical protein